LGEEGSRRLNKNAQGIRASGPYCGLYCTYGIFKFFDIEIDFKELMRPEYLSSDQGSSLPELEKAFKNRGLHTFKFQRLSTIDMENMTCPAILNVRGKATSNKYDHYVLFLGMLDGKAIIVDAPQKPQYMPLEEIAAFWNGRGMAISKNTIEPVKLFYPSYCISLMLLSLMACCQWALQNRPAKGASK